MMDGAPKTDLDAVRAAAVTYCEGLHSAGGGAFGQLFHDNYHMATLGGSGQPVLWDKMSFLSRVSGRDALPGEPDYEILTIDVAGDMAHVKLQVAVPPRRYEDYLGFVRVDGQWKLIQKLFRTIDGPAIEG